MYEYRYKVEIIGVDGYFNCTVTFTDKQHECDVIDNIMTSEFHTVVPTAEGSKNFIPKTAVKCVCDIVGIFI
jgi:hypothetical protein